MDTRKHGSQENLSIQKISHFFIFNLVIRKKLVNHQNLNKSRLHCSDIVAYDRINIVSGLNDEKKIKTEKSTILCLFLTYK